MRQKIYGMINASKDPASVVYNCVMLAAILASLVPLAFKNSNTVFFVLDCVTVTLFILDYVLRLITADLKLKRGALSFFLYPITFMALIDLVSIVPTFLLMASGLQVLKLLRLTRFLRVLRVFKLARYSRSLTVFANVIRKQKANLTAVATLAVAYILISALIIFNVEPDTFHNFFDAIYWATISLTTLGYGDIYPVTNAGRIVTMLSSFVGIAIVALPSGIITAGIMREIGSGKEGG